MTGREKIEAALSDSGSPQTPAVLCYEGIYVRDHWTELTACPWWYVHSPLLEHQLTWHRDVIRMTGQDWLVVPAWYSAEERQHLRIKVRPEGVFRVDGRTGQAQQLEEPAVGGQHYYGRSYARGYENSHPAFPADARAIDEAIALPDLPARDALLEEGRADLAAALLQGPARHLYPICHVSSPLWTCLASWRFSDVMAACLDAPELVERACGRFLGRQRLHIRRCAALGARGIWIEECMTDMLGPDAFARLNVPFVRGMVDEIRACGMKSIYYFCGNPTGKWDLLFEAGADALSLEEGKKGFAIEIEEVVERARGLCAVLGNLDAITLLERGSEEELRTEVGRQVSAGRRNGGRFVMSLGSPVTPRTPAERVRRYCDLVHGMGLS